MNTKLAATVAATNLANKTANELAPLLRGVFEKFVGQKIVKADGSLLAKILPLLPALPCTTNLRVWKRADSYSLVWGVQASKSADGIASYHETSLYIGFLKGDTLEKMADANVLRTDYTVEEVEEKRAALKVAKQALNDAQAALGPFGEYDR